MTKMFWKYIDCCGDVERDYPTPVRRIPGAASSVRRHDRPSPASFATAASAQAGTSPAVDLEVGDSAGDAGPGGLERTVPVKEHPGVTNSAATEIAGLDRFPNVLKIKNEETIGDCISVCDVWMAYESTTAIEAWLLGKPTLFVNPSGGDFQRASVHEGNPVLETAEAVDGALREHHETGEIEGFEARRDARQAVLADDPAVDRRSQPLARRALHRRPAERVARAAPLRRPRDARSARAAPALRRRGPLALAAGISPLRSGAPEASTSGELAQARGRAADATAGLEPTLRPDELAELEAVNA